MIALRVYFVAFLNNTFHDAGGLPWDRPPLPQSEKARVNFSFHTQFFDIKFCFLFDCSINPDDNAMQYLKLISDYITSEIFQTLLIWGYTGQLDITNENAIALLLAFDYNLASNMVILCANFVVSDVLAIENAWKILTILLLCFEFAFISATNSHATS